MQRSTKEHQLKEVKLVQTILNSIHHCQKTFFPKQKSLFWCTKVCLVTVTVLYNSTEALFLHIFHKLAFQTLL